MADDVYSVTFFGNVAGQPTNNVLHFANDQVAAANPILVANEIMDALGDGTVAGTYTKEYLDCLPDNFFFLGMKCRRVNNGGGPTVSRVLANVPGNRASSADVSGVGPVGLYHAPLVGGVWRTGKIFFPGVSIDDVSLNAFTGTLITAIQVFLALAEVALALATAGNAIQVVWSKLAADGLTILDTSNSLKVGTQRRRYVPL